MCDKGVGRDNPRKRMTESEKKGFVRRAVGFIVADVLAGEVGSVSLGPGKMTK
jgi:hypothetical protein